MNFLVIVNNIQNLKAIAIVFEVQNVKVLFFFLPHPIHASDLHFLKLVINGDTPCV